MDNEQSTVEENQKYLESLRAVKQKGEDDYEKNIVYITAGTLVLSMTYLEKLVNVDLAVWKWALISSWVLLAASLLSNLISNQMSSRFHARIINSADIHSETFFEDTIDDLTRPNKIIVNLNYFATSTLIVGIFFLILFCSKNLYTMPKSTERITPNTPSPGEKKGRTIDTPRRPAPQAPSVSAPSNNPATSPNPPSNPSR